MRLRGAIEESECGTPEIELGIDYFDGAYEGTYILGQVRIEETVADIIRGNIPDIPVYTGSGVSPPNPASVPWVIYKPGPV